MLGPPVKAKRKLKTEEHDARVDLFRDHIWPRLVDGAVAFAVGNGGKRHPYQREPINPLIAEIADPSCI